MEVVKMKKVLILSILCLFTSPAYAATAYRWVDKGGVVNYTDDYSNIPPEYRARVSTEVMEEIASVTVSTSPQATPQKIEEAKTDIYGLDETWWREKVHPWKEQLKEATANYETTNEKIIERAEALSRKYWSPTQYKMNMVDLEKLKEGRMKYRAQIDEANEMLKKLTKEAMEAKADPTWLN
jgi:hypothetical protein